MDGDHAAKILEQGANAAAAKAKDQTDGVHEGATTQDVCSLTISIHPHSSPTHRFYPSNGAYSHGRVAFLGRFHDHRLTQGFSRFGHSQRQGPRQPDMEHRSSRKTGPSASSSRRTRAGLVARPRKSAVRWTKTVPLVSYSFSIANGTHSLSGLGN